MTLKSKNLINLNDYLDKLSEAYIHDYGILSSLIWDAKQHTTDENNSHLDWCMVHFNTSMVDIHKTIKNIQARLREIDAGTKIQE